MDQEIYEKAQDEILAPDIIVSMHDHKIIFASDICAKLIGKKKSDIEGHNAYDFEDLPLDKAQIRSKETMATIEGEKEYPVKTNKGTFITKFTYKIFEYDSTRFFVGKIASISPQK